jgi:hypothetical protein
MLLKGDGKGNFTKVPEKQSGIVFDGAVRDIIMIQNKTNRKVIIARNNNFVKIFN